MRFVIQDFRIQSANNRLMRSRTTKRLILNNKYRKTKDDLILLLRTQITSVFFKPYEKDIVIKIDIETYKDLDNIIKLIIDALQGAGIIKNDREVMRIVANKAKCKKYQNEIIFINVIGD